MRYTSLIALAILALAGCPPQGGGGPLPGSQSADLSWNTQSRTVQWTYHNGSQPEVAIRLDLLGGTDARLTVGNEPAFDATFERTGRIRAKPSSSAGKPSIVPVYLDLLQIGNGQTLTTGQPMVRRIPEDSELRDNELTIQSEVRAFLLSVENRVALVRFESYYRVIVNPALDSFLSDALGGAPAPEITALIDGARNFRLAGVGTVAIEVGTGEVIKASMTAVGLPTETLTAEALESHPDAYTYTLVRQKGTP